jgi:Mg/Co/Ni transporter MgtE
MSADFITAKKTTSVTEILAEIRGSYPEPHSISYIYLLDDGKHCTASWICGILSSRAETVLLGDLMVSPVVSAVTIDPVLQNNAWLVNEKINSQSVWGSRFGHVTFP